MNEAFIPLYNTPQGRKLNINKAINNVMSISNKLFFTIPTEEVYNETLATVKQSFPQYVDELQGIADGAQVEFYKVRIARNL